MDSNKISIYKRSGRDLGAVEIKSNSPMFQNEYLIVKILDYTIEISTPDIDYEGKMYKTYKREYESNRCIRLPCVEDIAGHYQIDEESTEDVLIFEL